MATQQEWQEAGNPTTTAARLAQLSVTAPDLRPIIIQNPSCPPALREQIMAAQTAGFGAVPPAAVAAPAPTQKRSPVTAIVAGLVALVLVLGVSLAVVFMMRPDAGEEVITQPADGQQSAPSEVAPDPGEAVQPVAPVEPAPFTVEAPPQPESVPVPSTPVPGPSNSANGSWRAPAPTTAVSQPKIDTPSKNLSCEFFSDGVYCSIKDREFGSGGCSENGTWFSIAATERGVEKKCGEKYLGQVGDRFYELQYGQTSAVNQFACTVEESGLTCWNQISGEGFTLARSGYTTF